MKGLIIKDLLNLKKNFKSLFFIIVFYIVFSFAFSNANFLSGMIILLFSIMSINSFSYDSTAKWDRYALSLPISRKDIVVSKYVVSVLLIICGAAISTILNILLSIYKNTFTTDVFIINYSILFVAVVYISILIPLIYKFGVEKSRILIFAVFFIPTIIVTLSSRLGISLPPVSTIELIIKISPLIMIAIFYSSFLISYKIYNDKEI